MPNASSRLIYDGWAAALLKPCSLLPSVMVSPAHPAWCEEAVRSYAHCAAALLVSPCGVHPAVHIADDNKRLVKAVSKSTLQQHPGASASTGGVMWGTVMTPRSATLQHSGKVRSTTVGSKVLCMTLSCAGPLWPAFSSEAEQMQPQAVLDSLWPSFYNACWDPVRLRATRWQG